jgi:carbohydrate-binding DOMON domain-containing protein
MDRSHRLLFGGCIKSQRVLTVRYSLSMYWDLPIEYKGVSRTRMPNISCKVNDGRTVYNYRTPRQQKEECLDMMEDHGVNQQKNNKTITVSARCCYAL